MGLDSLCHLLHVDAMGHADRLSTSLVVALLHLSSFSCRWRLSVCVCLTLCLAVCRLCLEWCEQCVGWCVMCVLCGWEEREERRLAFLQKSPRNKNSTVLRLVVEQCWTHRSFHEHCILKRLQSSRHNADASRVPYIDCTRGEHFSTYCCSSGRSTKISRFAFLSKMKS